MPKSELLERARRLRVQQTDCEGKLWAVLRNRRLGGWKWKRQVPHGPYILDFYCAERNLVVELDGSQHLEPEAQAYDARRTARLHDDGLRVIRFTNGEVIEMLDGLAQAILSACGGDRS